MQNSNAATKALADPSDAPGHLLPSPAWLAVREGKKKIRSNLILLISMQGGRAGSRSQGFGRRDVSRGPFLVFHRCLKGRANSAAEVAASLERLESPVPPSSQRRGFGCWK